MGEPPKLFNNKPSKEQVKQFMEQQKLQKGKDFSTPSASGSSAMGSHSYSTPPPQPPKESFARRYKFLWPMLLAVNFAIGAYLFARTKKKDSDVEEEVPAAVTEKPVPSPPVAELVKVRDPIPENQQRELFKWILEEKRKVKPKDPEEKKKIDEEKAILKQYIRAKSIPTI